MESPPICVVHLVREKNGIEPLRNFLSTYKRFTAGTDHALVFLLKGFRADRIDEEYDDLLNSVPHQRTFVADWGYDITAYFRATARYAFPYYCFLNSFSEILDDDWLEKFYRAIRQKDVGLVGATGSYQGFNPDWEQMPHIGKVFVRARWKKLLLKVPYLVELRNLGYKLSNPGFPNPHLRTNAFLIGRETMSSLRPRFTLTKRQAYRFESGRRSMTSQVLRMGKTVLVVGKDGVEYKIEKWAGSRTFWEYAQENLLVSDNQTRRYMSSDPCTQEVLNWCAWGLPRNQQSRKNITSNGR